MASGRSSLILRHIRKLAGASLRVKPGGTPGELPDRELVRRFAIQSDEAAFAALVRRHGSLVLSVCQRVLHNWHDAEDAFQATFLVLSRKAASLRRQELVGNWLYGVAYRLAQKARVQAARRCRGVVTAPLQRSPADPLAEITGRELVGVLDEELSRLPEKYRAPLVLCCLEGTARDEAAGQLGWSLSTLKRRLERGRELLRGRLTRRGLALSAVLSAPFLTEGSGQAAVPATLVDSTIKAAILFRAAPAAAIAISADVAALARDTLQAMFVAKMKMTAVLLLAVGVVAAGAGMIARQALAQNVAQEKPTKESGVVGVSKGTTKADQTKVKETKQDRTDRYGDPLPPGVLARMGTVRFRHGDQIEGIALSPDGRTLAAASRDQTVRLWDVATGKELRRFPDHDGSLRFVAFSPDGTILASGVNPSESIRLWDPATGKELRKLKFPWQWLGHMRFSPDGKLVAAAGARHHILLWETATGRLLRQLDGHEDTSFAVPLAFSPDGRMLASGGQGETLRLWNLATGKEERRFIVQPPLPKEKIRQPFNDGLVEALVFSPDGRGLASGALRSPVRIWDVATGKEIHSLKGDPSGAFSLAFSPDGKSLVSGEAMGLVRVWETATGKEIRQLQAHKGWVSGLAFAHDGRTLVTSGDSIIRLWELRTGKEIVPDRGHSASITSSALLPNRRTLVTGSSDGTVRWWNLATGNELDRFAAGSDWPHGMTLSPNGAKAACFKLEKVGENELSQVGVELWDLTARRKLALLRRPNIFGAMFSADGKTLLTQAWDLKEKAGIFRLWDVATGKELRVLGRVPNSFHATALSLDGKLVAGRWQQQECTVQVWDLATGKMMRRLPGDRDFNQCLAFSPDSKLLAVADGPRPWPDSRVVHQHIHLWDLATGKEVLQFGRSSRGGYWPATFSPDGKTLVTAGEDNRVRLWEVATGGEQLALAGHSGHVRTLLFAENGRTLISTSDDTTALVWDVTGLRKGERLPVVPLSSHELRERWVSLAGGDATKAYAASWALVAATDQSVSWMKDHLPPAATADPKRLAQLLAELNSDRFAVREKAMAELGKLAELAESALQKAVLDKPTLEVRRRLERLLESLKGPIPPGERLRALRAVEVLEHIGTPEAREILQTLAKGAPEARLTQDAKASVDRLAKRSASTP